MLIHLSSTPRLSFLSLTLPSPPSLLCIYLFLCARKPFPLARSFVPPPILFFSYIVAAIGPLPMAPCSPPRPRHCAHPAPSPLFRPQPSPNFNAVLMILRPRTATQDQWSVAEHTLKRHLRPMPLSSSP
ncbi:hypothetical protein C8J57DRAFT_1347580, partial [Mycena rebaudengoi]